MGYGAVFSDDQRGNEAFERAAADWQAIQDHPDLAIYVDGGGRASVHRRDTLVVASDQLEDPRLRDTRRDLGITDESWEEARASRDEGQLGYTSLRIGSGQSVVAATEFLRSLGGRRPLRVGPDHALWPTQGRGFGPASPPRRPTARVLKASGRGPKPKERKASVKVAVLDTGYIKGDPLTDACSATVQLDTRWDGSQLSHWVGAHGTHVAGVLATAAGGSVRINHYNVGRSFGDDGLPLVADTDLAEAIALALNDGCRVLNLSLGGPTALDLGLVATSLAIARCAGERTARGVQRDDAVIVSSAGNEGTTQPMFPAAMKGVVGVGALDVKGNRPSFSNHGWWVDCATAGVDVFGPHVRGKGGPKPNGRRDTFEGYALWSGTSFAAPFVAGRIAAAMAGPDGIPSARIAAATVLSQGTPLDPALGLGVRIS